MAKPASGPRAAPVKKGLLSNIEWLLITATLAVCVFIVVAHFTGEAPWAVLLLLLAVLAIVAIALTTRAKPDLRVCTQCGTVGEPTTRWPGSGVLEVVLWVGALAIALYRLIEWQVMPPLAAIFYSLHLWVLMIPLGYSIYRAAGRKRVCVACASPTIVPPNSPVGRRIIEEQRDHPAA